MSEYKKKMDIEEAIFYCDWYKGARAFCSEKTEAAIETLLAAYHELKDKDTFKEVLYESDGDADGYPVYDMARCPNCNHLFMNDEHDWGIKYCPECGQALKWDIEEDKPTTKNDLVVDCRSLEDIKKLIERKADDLDGVMLDAGGVIIGLYFAIANDLPPVTQEPRKGHCKDCKYFESKSEETDD